MFQQPSLVARGARKATIALRAWASTATTCAHDLNVSLNSAAISTWLNTCGICIRVSVTVAVNSLCKWKKAEWRSSSFVAEDFRRYRPLRSLVSFHKFQLGWQECPVIQCTYNTQDVALYHWCFLSFWLSSSRQNSTWCRATPLLN